MLENGLHSPESKRDGWILAKLMHRYLVGTWERNNILGNLDHIFKVTGDF